VLMSQLLQNANSLPLWVGMPTERLEVTVFLTTGTLRPVTF